MDLSNWKTSILRWIAWVVLCAGMVYGIFVIREVVVLSLSRGFAQQAIDRDKAGRLMDVTQLSNWADFDTILIMAVVGCVMIALVVCLDYYLRNGERKGRLFRRIGLIFGIEFGVYALTLLVQYALTAFG